jgi:hypothetical protein
MFAVTNDLIGARALGAQQEVVVVGIADLSVRRFPLAQATDWMRWARYSDGLLLQRGHQVVKLDLVTGEQTVIDPSEVDDAMHVDVADEAVCPALGMQLQIIRTAKRQSIVAVSTARATDPDTLPPLERRVLVSATNRSWHPRGGGEPPGKLIPELLTSSCEHFVFTLGENVYVGRCAK